MQNRVDLDVIFPAIWYFFANTISGLSGRIYQGDFFVGRECTNHFKKVDLLFLKNAKLAQLY